MNFVVEMTFICHLIIFTLVPLIYGAPVNSVVKNNPKMDRVAVDPSETWTTKKPIPAPVSTKKPLSIPAPVSTQSNKINFPEENVKEKKSNPNKISSFDDYYGDYMGDSAGDGSYSKNNNNMEQLRSTTQRPTSMGCPHTHSICQHHCESDMYYSGYCEGDVCHCYGKL